VKSVYCIVARKMYKIKYFLTRNNQQLHILIYYIVTNVACYMFRPPIVIVFMEVFFEVILHRTLPQFVNITY